MTTRWRVIDLIDHSGDIDVRRGHLVISDSRVPLDDVSCILTGTKTHWSGSLVALAAKYEVPMIACTWRGVPLSVSLPWSSNSRVATRHNAQAALSIPRKKNAWMRIIRAKVTGQANNLRHVPIAQQILLDHARQIRSGDPDNREARAARTYWANFFPHERFTRDIDGPGRNAQLNYGYTVMRGFVIRSIVTAGLWPTLGIWHHSRGNAFGLADDLIEPFRPAIDHAVAALPVNAMLEERETKTALVAALSLPMAQHGETVMTRINEFTQQFAGYIEGDTTALAVPIWIPPDG